MPARAGCTDGQREVEVAAVVEAAFNGYLSALRFDEAAHEGEAHAGAGSACAGEAVEDAGKALGFDAAAGIDDEKLYAVAQFDGFEADLAVARSVAEGVLNEIVEDGPESAAVCGDIRQIFKGLDGNADVFGLGLWAMSGRGILKGVVRAELFGAELAAARVQFRDFHEVGHDVVEFFGFEFAAMRDLHLEVIEVAGVAARERIEGEAQVLEGFLQFLRGDIEEARFESVDFGEGGDIFEERNRAEEAAVEIAHGRGAEAVAVFGLADAHGKDCGFAFAGRLVLHGDGGANGGEDAVAAGSVGEGVAILRRCSQEFLRGLVEFKDVAFGIRNNDGLKYGLHDGIGELLLHLAASALGFAEVAKTDSEAVDFGRDSAEVIAGAPLDAMLEIAAADLTGRVSGAAQGQNQRRDHQDGDENGGDDGEAAEGDEAGAERVFAVAKAVDDTVALGMHVLEGDAPLLFDSNDLAVVKIFDAHAGDGAAVHDLFVFAQEFVELEGGIDGVRALCGGDEEFLGGFGLALESEEGLFAFEGCFGGEHVFLSEGRLSGLHGGEGVLGDADVGF